MLDLNSMAQEQRIVTLKKYFDVILILANIPEMLRGLGEKIILS